MGEKRQGKILKMQNSSITLAGRMRAAANGRKLSAAGTACSSVDT
jgi:hypothetical protein